MSRPERDWPSRVSGHTERYGLVSYRWEHHLAILRLAVMSVAWQNWTGTPSEAAATEQGACGTGALVRDLMLAMRNRGDQRALSAVGQFRRREHGQTQIL